MPLHIKAADVPVRKRDWEGTKFGAGAMEVRKAFGKEGSLMVADRQPGYHTRPHQHAAEQINYVLEGEIWFFVENKAFHCKKGDFQRIPANTIHWAWNRSDQVATVIEAHSPPLVGGATADGSVGLFDDDEEPSAREVSDNEFVEYDADAVEARTVAQPV